MEQHSLLERALQSSIVPDTASHNFSAENQLLRKLGYADAFTKCYVSMGLSESIFDAERYARDAFMVLAKAAPITALKITRNGSEIVYTNYAYPSLRGLVYSGLKEFVLGKANSPSMRN